LFEAKPGVPYVIANTIFGEATYKLSGTKSLRIEAQYLKTKKLIAELDIFFKNPESDHPEIQLKTKN
jgi:hypothetical protein